MKKTLKMAAAFLLSAAALVPLLSCASTGAEGSGKPVVLVVSFGTSFNDSREKTIGAIESAVRAAYPDYEIRRAFTSQIVINHIRTRDGLRIDNVKEAMNRLRRDKVKTLVVQPTHIMNGLEYDEMIAGIRPFERYFDSVKYGQPLLAEDRDFAAVAPALVSGTAQYQANDTAIIFMGHGTEHNANAVYARLDGLLKNSNPRYFVATVEAAPTLDDVIAALGRMPAIKKIVLLPFMIVAGDHANNDMAGDEADSWKSILQAKGYSVTPVLRGLGEYPEIQAIFVRHTGEAASR